MSLDVLWRKMQTETLNGIPLSDVIGGGDPQIVAEIIAGSIDKHMPLQRDAIVLDVGCGCGRIAGALTSRLDATARYTGIDIVPGLIDFARRNITADFPHFQFFVRDQQNQSYDYYIGGQKGAISSISDVVADGSIDNCIGVSLFTHLDRPQSSELLHEIARALKPGGQMFMTCFFLSSKTRSAISRPDSKAAFLISSSCPKRARLHRKE